MNKILCLILLISLSFANVKFWDGDNIKSKGLSGKKDSLGYRVHELELHFHNSEYWYGSTAGHSPAVSTSVGVHFYPDGAY